MEHMTTEECADYLKVHPNTLRRYVHEEDLPVLKFPGRRAWVFRKDLVDAWVYEMSQPKIINDPNDRKVDDDDDRHGRLRVLSP